MMVVLGSLTRVSGAIVGAFIITVLPVMFEHFEDYKTLVFGVTMVLIMKFMPSGLVDGLLALGKRFTSKSDRKTGVSGAAEAKRS
jgi:branched-chain amino acid transport system permease protein